MIIEGASPVNVYLRPPLTMPGEDHYKLIPPSNLDFDILKCAQEQTRIMDQEMQMATDDLRVQSDRLKELHQERLKQMEEAGAKQQAMGTWEIASQVISCIGSLASFAFAGIAFATGAGIPLGIALVSLGAVMVANQLATTFGAWPKLAHYLAAGDRAKEEKILNYLTIISNVLGVVLSITSALLGAFGTSLSSAIKIASYVFQGSTSFASGVVAFGKGYAGKENLDAKAELKRLERKIENNTHQRQNAQEKMEDGLERAKQCDALKKKTVEGQHRVYQIINEGT